MADKKVVLEQQKLGVKRFSFEDWSEGTWLTPAQLCKELGGDVEACRNWIASCIEMGPDQFKLNVTGFLS